MTCDTCCEYFGISVTNSIELGMKWDFGYEQSDIRAFGITGDWETMSVKAEVWVEALTKSGRRFMAAWRQEEENAARHRQEKREATRLGKFQSHTEA